MPSLHEAPTHEAVRPVVDGRARRVPGESGPLARRCQSRRRLRHSSERADVEQRQRDLNEERGDRDCDPDPASHSETSAPAGHRGTRRRAGDQGGADDTRTFGDGQGDGHPFKRERRHANMPAMAHRRTPLVGALALNTAALVVEVGAGIPARSLSLVMDGVHNASDEVALGFLVLAYTLRVGLSGRFLRSANLFNSVGLLAISALLVWQVFERLARPETVLSKWPLSVAWGWWAYRLCSGRCDRPIDVACWSRARLFASPHQTCGMRSSNVRSCASNC